MSSEGDGLQKEQKISTGSPVFDDLLDGGFETDIVTTVYGPSGSGKSNLCLVALAANADKKIFYVDTESGLSVNRLQQISHDYEALLDNVVVLRPGTLEDQGVVFEKLKNTLNDKVGLVIVDSIAMLYRLEVAKRNDIKTINQSLAEQIANLIRIARDKNIPVLVTNQVYSSFDEKEKVNLVGGDILRYASKCLIELQKEDDHRIAVIRKHRSMPAGKSAKFKIVDDGLLPYNG